MRRKRCVAGQLVGRQKKKNWKRNSKNRFGYYKGKVFINIFMKKGKSTYSISDKSLFKYTVVLI
jgi:hypothetical protein